MKATLDTLGLDAVAALPPEKRAERMQVLALVEQFEGMLLTEMLRDVQAGDQDEGEAFGLGGSTMTDVMQGEFGLALSRAGGIGLGRMLADALGSRGTLVSDTAAHVDGPSREAGAPEPGAEGIPVAGPAAALGLGTRLPGAISEHDGRAADIVAASVPVTSEYGWRSDPFTGQARFHRGVDLALAYGSDVRSFGAGVVRSAGERQGYGLTVVVDHGQGRETLYAHLSAVDVAPGQVVDAGQRIARSGSSGRATGAHLHFEAREFGQPVDAGRLAAGWAGRPLDTSVGESDEIGSDH